MSFTIRPLTDPDHDQWVELWRGYLRFYKTELPPGIYTTTWRRLLADGEGPYGYCAEIPAGRLVGIVHYLFHASCWTHGPYCYLQDLYVSDDARGEGIGRALIDKVVDAAAQHDASQVYWLTQNFNERARHLYDQVASVTPFIKYVKAV